MIQPHLGDVVVPNLHADGVLHGSSPHTAETSMRDLPTHYPAIIDLLLLIAAHRVIEEEREVRDQIEIVLDAVEGDLGQRLAAAVLPFRSDAVSRSRAAVTRIDAPEASDETLRDGALGRRFGGVPLPVIPHERER